MRTTAALGAVLWIGCTGEAPVPAGDPLPEEPPPDALVARFVPRAADLLRATAEHMPVDVEETARTTLASSPHPPCLDPAPPSGAFRDGLPESGITFVHQAFPGPENDRLEDPLTARFHLAGIAGGGVAAADLNGDGRPDLFFAQTLGPNAVYWGAEEGFVPAANTGLELSGALTTGASVADFDGDELPDVAVFGLDLLRLFRNDGDGSFTDVTDAWGVESAAGWTSGVSWADVDADGDLDLLAAGYAVTAFTENVPLQASRTQLYRNDHTRFTDISDSLPEAAVHGAALLATFRDFDRDGDSDLLIAHDFGDTGENTVLLDNAGIVDGVPHWIDRFPSSGAGVLRAPMGAATRDLDGDGHIDLWFSDLGDVRPLQSLGGFDFLDASLSWGLNLSSEPGDTSWSVVALDLGGWGWPGLYFAYGPLPPAFRASATEVLEQPDRWLAARIDEGEIGFQEAPDVLPAGPAGDSRGVAVADFDRNGVPDLAIGRIGQPPGLLYGRCTDAHRLVVELSDLRRADPRGVGTVVTVVAGGARRSRTIDAGGLGTYSGSEPVAFFGLGARDRVDELIISWPDGLEDRFDDVCSHCRVRVSRD